MSVCFVSIFNSLLFGPLGFVCASCGPIFFGPAAEAALSSCQFCDFFSAILKLESVLSVALQVVYLIELKIPRFYRFLVTSFLLDPPLARM